MRIALVAGETSGDTLGAALIDALRRQFPQAEFAGVAGPRMKAAGCTAWHDIEELAVMGLTDVITFLQKNGANINAPDKRGYTAIDYARGLAGGFGFGGSASVVHEATAKVIADLGGTPGTPIPAAPAARRDRNQDDPQDDRN